MTTRGNQTNKRAVLPQAETMIINEDYESTITLNTNTNYDINVYKTTAKTMSEYLNKKNEQNIRGEKLGSLNFTPTRDEKVLEIVLNEIAN